MKACKFTPFLYYYDFCWSTQVMPEEYFADDDNIDVFDTIFTRRILIK